MKKGLVFLNNLCIFAKNLLLIFKNLKL